MDGDGRGMSSFGDGLGPSLMKLQTALFAKFGSSLMNLQLLNLFRATLPAIFLS